MGKAAAGQYVQERNPRHSRPRPEEPAGRDPRPHRDPQGGDRRCRRARRERADADRLYPRRRQGAHRDGQRSRRRCHGRRARHHHPARAGRQDRKSTRLNSSHVKISYAVFCLKKKKKKKKYLFIKKKKKKKLIKKKQK